MSNFQPPSESIYEALMTDPEKRAKVLELLTQEGLVTVNENVSPNRLQSKQKSRNSLNMNPSLLKQLYSPKITNKPKVRMESPSALCRRRALEALNEDAGTRKSIPKSIPFDCLLNGVVGYCEVRSSTGDRSAGIKAMMKVMGATVLDNFTTEVTHVVYKEGTYATFQKAKLLQVHLVSVLWLEAVRRSKRRVPEEKFPARCVEDPASDAVAIQSEFDDIVQDEYRKSRAVAPLGITSPAVNHVTQRRFKSVARKDDADLEDDITTQMRVIHNSQKTTTSHNNTHPSASDSFYSLNSNSSNDDIVPCSQDARTSLSKTHKTYNSLETIESSHVTKRKTYQTIAEVIDESPEISQDHSILAKLTKDSLELPKAQKIRSPESIDARRALIEKTREEIEKYSEDMHLHITTTDESKSSLNSTGRKLESLLVRNPLNNHWRRNTITSGSVSKTNKRRINDLGVIEDSLSYVTPSRRSSRSSCQIISEANIKDEETDEQQNSKWEPRTPRNKPTASSSIEQDDMFFVQLDSAAAKNTIEDENNLAKERNFRKLSAVQKNYEFGEDISAEQKQKTRINNKFANSSEDDLNSVEINLKTPRNCKKLCGTKEEPIGQKNSTQKRNNNITSSSEDDLNFDETNRKTPRNSKKQIGQKNSTKRKQKSLSSSEEDLNFDETNRKTPRNSKKQIGQKNSTKRKQKSLSSSEDDLNSEETNRKTPRNSKKLCGTKEQIGQKNSTKRKQKSLSSSEDNLNSEETNRKMPIQDSIEPRSKRKTVKSSTEINLIKPTINLNVSQSVPNLVSNDTNKIEPRKGRLRKLYNANDSINDEIFNVPNEIARTSNIVIPVKKPKYQVQMLPGFGPKTLSKKARACLTERKAPPATTETDRAATSLKKMKEKRTDLKPGSSTRPNKRSSRMLIFESESSENEVAPTPSRRKSMRILASSAKKNIGSASNLNLSPPSSKQLKQIGYAASSSDGHSESSRTVSPRKRMRNSRPINFNSDESGTASPRKSSKKAEPKTRRKKSSSSDDKNVEPLRRSTLDFQHKSSRQSLDQLRLTQKPKVVKLCSIVCTRLHKEDVQVFQQIVKKLGRFIVEDEVSERTTHLIAGSPVRTINVLRAIARGCWILKLEWLYKSLEAQQWLDEEQYELTEFSPVVQKCRLEKQSFGRLFSVDVFKDVGEIFVCRSSTPRFSDLEELVTLCGGKIVLTSRHAKICVGDYVCSKTATCVNEKWILDCITQYKKKSLKHYLIHENRSS